MESGFEPKDWLGFLLGEKYYFDFSGRTSFKERMDQLTKAIKFEIQATKKGKKKRISYTFKKYTFSVYVRLLSVVSWFKKCQDA